MKQPNSIQVLREARQEAVRRGLPATYHAVALILAGWCAALLQTTSKGYVRAGLPPVGDNPEPPENPTLLEGER